MRRLCRYQSRLTVELSLELREDEGDGGGRACGGWGEIHQPRPAEAVGYLVAVAMHSAHARIGWLSSGGFL